MNFQKIVEDLNCAFWEVTENDELYPFSYQTIGFDDRILFMGEVVYNSEDDNLCPDDCEEKCPDDCPKQREQLTVLIEKNVNKIMADINKWNGKK